MMVLLSRTVSDGCLFMLMKNWPFYSCLWWHFSNMNWVCFLRRSKNFRYSLCCLKRMLTTSLVPRLWVPDILFLLLFLDTQFGFCWVPWISWYLLLLISYIYIFQKIPSLWTDVSGNHPWVCIWKLAFILTPWGLIHMVNQPWQITGKHGFHVFCTFCFGSSRHWKWFTKLWRRFHF